MALTYSVRVSDGGTDYFHGFEYFGLITLVNRVFQVHLMRFFLRACGVSAAWLPSVPYCSGGIIYLCMLIVRLRLLCMVGGRSFFCAIYGFVCRLALWSRLCCLTSRFATSVVPFLVLCVSWLFVLCYSCSVCAGCAAGSCAGSCRCLALCGRDGDFFPKSAVFALVLGISVCGWGIFALALEFPGCAGGVAFLLRLPVLRLGRHLRWLALRFFSCGPHPWLSLRFCVGSF